MGLAKWFLSLFKVETIYNETNNAYIVRYHVLNNKAWCPYKIYIHNILRSDDDRDLHCHPWPFISFILKGGYKEYNLINGVITAKYWKRFSLIRHKAEDAHRLEVDKPVWTLVFLGRKCREWGFHTDKGWVHNQVYIENKYGQVHDFMM